MAVNRLTVEGGAIPTEFGKNSNSTLLVMTTGKKSYDNYAKLNFQSYKGPYVLVTKAEEASEKFSDIEKFRYYFSFDWESHLTSNGSISVRRFYVLDRMDNKVYRSTLTSSYFSKIMKQYVAALNMELEKATAQ